LGDWAVNVEGVEPSGWAFEFENENYPDTDDTAEILLALDKTRLNPKGESRKSAAIDRGFSWLMALQSSNGGWGAYDVDNDMELLYEIPFADFGAMIDPPSVDVTAHVLEMMGHFGFTVEDDRVKEILNYIREEQKEDGSWFGRWGINYIYGIGSVLPALEAVGENMEAPYVRRAVDWLVERQNEDGGWGETAATYDDPSLAGQGPSTASQTAWALLALLAASGDCPPVKRGVDYLLRTQNDQGTWEEKTYTGTGFPRDFYLRYELYSHYFPLLALGRYSSKIEEPL
jgi:squalene-hopene/tetraprenyl-beta-curcumene cyclase